MKDTLKILARSKAHAVSALLMGIALFIAPATYLRATPQTDGHAAQPPLTPKTIAAEDLTGYWVSVVTQDWRFRMLTPPKGDFGDIPVNQEARRVMAAWDPAKDEASNEPCEAYGAPALLSAPGRLHIQWQNDSTLRLDTDAGMQTRLFHFGGNAPSGDLSVLQGYSVASWGARQATRRPHQQRSAGSRATGLFESDNNSNAPWIPAQEWRAF